MHPPVFRIQDLLSDWPDCFLDLQCPSCSKPAIYPVALLRSDHGDVAFERLLPRLRCKTCRVAPAPVYLCASHMRTFVYGGSPQWAVELVPAPKSETQKAAPSQS